MDDRLCCFATPDPNRGHFPGRWSLPVYRPNLTNTLQIGHRLGDHDNCPMMANMGRNMPATMNPTTPPRNTMSMGSRAAVS